MQYSINPFVVNTTSEELQNYLQSFLEDDFIPENQINDHLEYNLDRVFAILRGYFSKMYYEIISDANRHKILEYCLTLFSGKIRNVFTVFEQLDIPIENKSTAGRYLVFHLIIFLAEKTNKKPLDVITEIEGLLHQESLKVIAKGYINPLQSFSSLSNTENLKVKLDESLIRIKYEGINTTTITTLLVFLLLYDLCTPFV